MAFEEPKLVMQRFADWLASPSTKPGARNLFVSDNNGFD